MTGNTDNGRQRLSRRAQIPVADSPEGIGEALQQERVRNRYSLAEKLLPAVDVVGRACEGRVGHDVYGERSYVGWFDDPPDGECGAKLVATIFEFIAEERCR
jgi:hypothetical protein